MPVTALPVNAVLKLLERAGIPIEVRYRHSTDALAAMVRQECDLAGFHVPLGKFQKPAMLTYTKWLEKRHDFYCIWRSATWDCLSPPAIRKHQGPVRPDPHRSALRQSRSRFRHPHVV